jgi:hypothetical protein
MLSSQLGYSVQRLTADAKTRLGDLSYSQTLCTERALDARQYAHDMSATCLGSTLAA